MKRSKSIRLVLMGSVTSAMLTGCGEKPAASTQNVYTNNFFIPGAGYYHAPFRGWYRLPYNYFDTNSKTYFYGGQWALLPCESITNISSPTTEAVQLARNARTDISRGGFGGYSSGYYGGYYGGGWSGFHSS